jgi:long-chain acyl-CoA synthetase
MTSKRNYFGKGSVVVATEGGSPVRRLAITADNLVTQPFEGIDIIPDVIDYAARTHGMKDAVGWRDIVDIHEEEKEVKKMVNGKEVTEKKTWKYFQLSDYKYLNFLDVQERVSALARGLIHHQIARDDIFNIYAQTSVNWQLMSHACTTIGTPVATAYDTLGESGLTHSLNEPNCVGVFTNADLLGTLKNVLPNTPSVRFIIYDGEAKPSLLDDIRNIRENVVILSIDELGEIGAAQSKEGLKERRPSKDDVALIMYTSGTTGAPKGVVLTHGNVIASVGAVYTLLGHHLTADDTFLAYLPLAHILEYIVELILFFVGMKTGYGRVKTLTDASVRQCKGDIVTFRPSIMVGVPAVWEQIRKGITSKINASGSLKKTIFNGAMAAKKADVPGLSQLADAVVLNNIKQATGGRLRLALSGGAALSKETQEFLSIALVTMLQGYGMTESCGMCAILPPELMQYRSVGLPVPSAEIKLLDVPEAGYKSTNNPPQGEVCIRGPSVTKGYYKRDDLNNDESIFTKDGWLRTGDVGQWNADGTLSLIDRIKNLIKLQGGEYIALEQLESTYKSCSLVANICVYADAEAKQPIGIIIPHEANLRHALEVKSNSANASTQLLDLCTEKAVQDLILKECNAIGKKNGFKPMEILEAVVLTAEEWTPESGLVTAAQKVQRSKVAKKFEKEIKAAYAVQ